MEFIGEIARADGSEEPLYVTGTWGRITMYINSKVSTLQDGDSLTISRTK